MGRAGERMDYEEDSGGLEPPDLNLKMMLLEGIYRDVLRCKENPDSEEMICELYSIRHNNERVEITIVPESYELISGGLFCGLSGSILPHQQNLRLGHGVRERQA